MVMWRVRRLISVIPRIFELIRDEYSSRLRRFVRWGDRLDCWRHGFISERQIIYDFSTNSKSDYLSDYRRVVLDRINGSFTVLLANKIMFDAVMRRFSDNIPITYGYIVNRVYQSLQPGFPVTDVESLLDWCVAGNDIVIKPHADGGGSGILVIGTHDGAIRVNGEEIEPETLRTRLHRLNLVVVQQKIEQANYAKDIFPGSTNTIRVLTIRDPVTGKPFVATAVHRFGGKGTGGVDNWTQGGLSTIVDIEHGVLGVAAIPGADGKVHWHESHPDTGARIHGIQVPGWRGAIAQLLDISAELPFWPYVGWDIVLDSNNRLKIIEGNHRSGVRMLQVHRPLLQDPRAREFFRQLR